MGEIRVKVKLLNLQDETRFRHGELKKEDIRTYEADAMVDTGAVQSVIPSHVLQQLGVGTRGTRVAEYADGRKDTVDISEGIVFDVLVVFNSSQNISFVLRELFVEHLFLDI